LGQRRGQWSISAFWYAAGISVDTGRKSTSLHLINIRKSGPLERKDVFFSDVTLIGGSQLPPVMEVSTLTPLVVLEHGHFDRQSVSMSNGLGHDKVVCWCHVPIPVCGMLRKHVVPSQCVVRFQGGSQCNSERKVRSICNA